MKKNKQKTIVFNYEDIPIGFYDKVFKKKKVFKVSGIIFIMI